MAYMNQEKKAKLSPAIKAVFKKYNVKGSIGVDNHSTLVINIQSSSIDFGDDYIQVNRFWIDENHEGIARDFLNEVHQAAMALNYDNSDLMSDYHDVGYYVNINIGKWNKPYILVK